MHSLFGTARDRTWDLSIPSRTFYHRSTNTPCRVTLRCRRCGHRRTVQKITSVDWFHSLRACTCTCVYSQILHSTHCDYNIMSILEQLYCHVQPRAALELAPTGSHSLALARPLVGSHHFALAKTRSCNSRTRLRFLELAHTRSHSFARHLASTRTRSLSIELSRTRSPGAAKPFSFHSLSSYAIPQMNPFAT